MDPFMGIGAGLLVIVLSIVALAVWRIGQVTSWRALARTARATGSFEECVAFIRFCAEEERQPREMRDFAKQRAISSPQGRTRALDEIGHVSG